MSEEEIIKYTKNILNATYIEATLLDKSGNFIETGLVNKEVIQGLLDLYNKEKEKNKFKDSKVRNLIAELDEQKEKYDEKIKQTTVAVIKLLKRTLLEETNE